MAIPHPYIPGAEIKAFVGPITVKDGKPRVRIPAATMRQARPAESSMAVLVEGIEALTAKIKSASAV